MSPDDKAKFLKFCWAQERLPTEFKSRFLIMEFPLKKGQESRSQKEEDMILPHASTCFFNLQLPKYSSLEVMRKKILQAINLDCISMNAEEEQLDNFRANNDRDEAD